MNGIEVRAQTKSSNGQVPAHRMCVKSGTYLSKPLVRQLEIEILFLKPFLETSIPVGYFQFII
jgi:hypothetical protein